ncbi:MAG: tetratricopeptide repeat protein [Bacteroidales bacterium]|nr:tetratricopeptide repeat protein [Bacteroidales bacterium]
MFVKNRQSKIVFNTAKIFVAFILVFWLVSTTGFAQNRQTYTPVQRTDSVGHTPAPIQRTAPGATPSTARAPTSQTNLQPLPVQNSVLGRNLKAVLDTVEFLLRPAGGGGGAFGPRNRPQINERRVQWNRALDTIETIAEPAKTDSLAMAYYFYGKGMIFRDKAWSGLFGRDSSVIFAREAIKNFELYAKIGLGNPTGVFESLAMMYYDFLTNSQRALEYLDRNLELNPRHIFTYVSKAQILRNIGRMGEACEVLQKATEIEHSQTIEMMMITYGCR